MTELPQFATLAVREESHALLVTIQRPEAMNALNALVIAELDGLFDWLEAKIAAAPGAVRTVILTGAGEKAFVAGADIKELENMNSEEASELSRRGHRLLARIEALPVPVIAAVNGYALGGGLELALACDFMVASENAKFGLPETNLGVMPGYGGTVRLPRRVGIARAKELTFTGAVISAPEALSYGLVVKLCPQAELVATCLAIARQIAARAPLATGYVKRSIQEGSSLSLGQACELESRLFGEPFATDDKNEGVRAFIEKRKPVFQGK